jgi:AcrR family transcriptional regulator
MTDTATTRDRILDSAEALFAERGLAGTSVRDIAAESGLTAASLYNHFASKEALYEAVLERGVRPLLELLTQLAQGDRLEGRDDVIDALMRHLAQTPHLPRLVHHEAVTGGARLSRLSRMWIRPLVNEALTVLKRNDAPGQRWAPDEYPLLIASFLHLLFGHFAMAPLLTEVFDEDALSERSLERQTRFLRKLSRVLLGASDAEQGATPR